MSTATKPSPVSTITTGRGSEGAGLPKELSQGSIDLIVATAGVVAPKALDITKNMYGRMLKANPALLAYFNPAHNVPISTHQPEALAASIIAYATHIQDLSPIMGPDGPVAAIAWRHCALVIHPAQYFTVFDNLMAAIGEVLGDAVTPEIAAAWSEAVLFLAKAFIDLEESIYQKLENRQGGWSGLIDFEVADIQEAASGIKTLTFKPPAGSPLEGQKFEFSAGQYLSLSVDPEGDGKTAPRHYTVTSPSMADFLQCSIKKIPGGKVSTFVHDKLKVGDTVKLTAPCGIFTTENVAVESAVLLSAGIGITPMVALQNELTDKVKLAVHVDKSADVYAYREKFEGGLEKFTDVVGGRTAAADLVAEILEKAGKDNTFFICGPTAWMAAVQKELRDKGAKEVLCEVFGSQLASGCPFHA